MAYRLKIFDTKQKLLNSLADAIVSRIEKILDKEKECRIVVGGGRTPVILNQIIVERCLRSNRDWTPLNIYFSDERLVPEENEDNTAGMTRKTLAIPLGLPVENVHPIPTYMEADLAAEFYHHELEGLPPTEQGLLFHLAVLGLGPDGHTASLFPGSRALKETSRLAVSGGKDSGGRSRVTLTKTALEKSGLIWIMAAGSEKKPVIQKMLNGPWDPINCPVQLIDPHKARVVLWLGEMNINDDLRQASVQRV